MSLINSQEALILAVSPFSTVLIDDHGNRIVTDEVRRARIKNDSQAIGEGVMVLLDDSAIRELVGPPAGKGQMVDPIELHVFPGVVPEQPRLAAGYVVEVTTGAAIPLINM